MKNIAYQHYRSCMYICMSYRKTIVDYWTACKFLVLTSVEFVDRRQMMQSSSSCLGSSYPLLDVGLPYLLPFRTIHCCQFMPAVLLITFFIIAPSVIPSILRSMALGATLNLFSDAFVRLQSHESKRKIYRLKEYYCFFLGCAPGRIFAILKHVKYCNPRIVIRLTSSLSRTSFMVVLLVFLSLL